MSEVKVNKISPRSGTDVTLGDSGDNFTVPSGGTITIPSGATLTTTNATVNLPATTTVSTELKTNKISPASGTAFTLGDSGDTFTIPSGATITNSGTATGFGGGYTQATAVSASGTTVSFTGIPSGTNNIIITAENLSMSGSNTNFQYQIGDSGGIETSGYSSIDFYRGHSGGDMGTVTSTSGFILAYSFGAADVWSGNILLQRISGNKWVSTYTAQDITEYWRSGTGHKELSGELTQLQFSWVGGNSFDGGSVNIQYQ